MAISVLLDANVLHPQILCDLLLRLAEHNAFRPLWSARILEETIESILSDVPISIELDSSGAWTP